MIYSKQKAFCRSCGKEMQTDFSMYRGEVCGKECYEEIEWRKILSILGKEYYPKPQYFSKDN